MVGSAINVTVVNFPGNGSGQIVLNDGVQRVGQADLTVDAATTALSNGDELLELWWSSQGGGPNSLANDLDQPSFASFAIGRSSESRPLIFSKFLVSMTRDGVAQAPANPFGLPPLNNIRPHAYGRDFSVIELNGPPPGGFKYDEEGRLNLGLSSGIFRGQTFYNAGSVPADQGGTPPPFGPAGGLDMLGYGPLKSEIDGIYNAWVIRHAPIGDTRLDGVFDSADLIQAFQFGEYEDEIDLNSTWAAGDWNGDLEFDSDDLTFAMQSGSYQRGQTTVNAVPEPAALSMMLLGFLSLLRMHLRGK